MVARLPVAPSSAAQGMLGQAGTWGVRNHGLRWGRVGSPPREEGGVTPQALSPGTPLEPQYSPPPCYRVLFSSQHPAPCEMFIFACLVTWSISVPPSPVPPLERKPFVANTLSSS